MMFKQALQRAAFVALILPFCVIIAACTTSTGNAPDPTPTPTHAVAAACQVSQLTLAYAAQQEGAANRADEFSVQNSASAACMLSGYPQLQVINDINEQIKLQATQATSGYFYQQIPAQPVTLQPGAKAYFIIEWAAGTCSARAAYQGVTLQFGLSGQTSTRTVSMDPGAEKGPIYCGDQLALTISPFSGTDVFAKTGMVSASQ